jgi:sigma-E factor negative regulatory protein RseA
MNENLEEQISALMDGEAAAHEVSPVLAKMRSNPELRERWARYHFISDALHNNLPGVDYGLGARVWSALQSEAPILVPKRRTYSIHPWLKQAAGMAVAVSVTAMAILTFQSMNRTTKGQSTKAALANGQEQPSSGWERSATDGVSHGEDVVLDSYLINHNEHAVSAGMVGMLPYARLVSQDQGSAE